MRDRSADASCSSANRDNGLACSCSAQCKSKFCVEGYCCNSACQGTCQTCSQAMSLGTCTMVAAGVKPSDPSDCHVEANTTCGQDGTCDGKGGCRLYPVGTVCIAGTCQGAEIAGTRVCDGAGACRAGAINVCAPFLCSTTHQPMQDHVHRRWGLRLPRQVSRRKLRPQSSGRSLAGATPSAIRSIAPTASAATPPAAAPASPAIRSPARNVHTDTRRPATPALSQAGPHDVRNDRDVRRSGRLPPLSRQHGLRPGGLHRRHLRQVHRRPATASEPVCRPRPSAAETSPARAAPAPSTAPARPTARPDTPAPSRPEARSAPAARRWTARPVPPTPTA